MRAYICVALVALFVGLSWCSILTKSSTYDEPVHALAGWTYLKFADFRMNPEHPPLWKYWAALPHSDEALLVHTAQPLWQEMLRETNYEWDWAVGTLYQTPGNFGEEFVKKSRAMMLVMGVLLGLFLCFWSWHIGGPVAAVTATWLYAFDPNFLAHAPLVTNDVMTALIFCGLIYVIWKIGQSITLLRVFMVGVLCGLGIAVKYTALVFAPLIGILLAFRAVSSHSWSYYEKKISGRGGKFLMAITLYSAVGLVSYSVLWAAYGFRFEPTSEQGVKFDLKAQLPRTAINELNAKLNRAPTDEEVANWTPGLLVRGIILADEYQLLPQAFLKGLLNVHMRSQLRSAYLLGDFSVKGWWYYFPVAMIVKTPVSVIALGVFVFFFSFWKIPSGSWTVICLGFSMVFITAVMMRANLNIGLRHILLIYPLIYLCIAAMTAYLWKNGRQIMRVTVVLLSATLAYESLTAFPDYLSYFNFASGGARGGLRILGDSNLDWGQDLPALAQWQKSNPDTKLYLNYFGNADPAAYGIRYTNLPGGYRHGPKPEVPKEPSVLAISATNLQGIYYGQELRDMYAPMKKIKPMAVLGGSIYLYQIDVQQ